MDYGNLLKQIDAEIERLKKAREVLAAAAKPKKTTYKLITKAAPKKKAPFGSVSGSILSTRSKKDAKRSRASGRIFETKRGDRGRAGGGTDDGGYGIVR